MKIYINIPTLNRPESLVLTLEFVAKIQPPPNSQIFVLLIDNNDKQISKPIFDSQSQNFPFPFFYCCQPQRGAARAKNMGIEKTLAADCDAVFFVADDMRLPPDYLKELTAEMQKRNADVVRGKMKIIKENGQIDPIRRASLFSRRDILPGNGALVAAKVFKDYNLRLDENFVLGSEEGDFFYRAHLCGARLFSLEHLHFFEYRPDSRNFTGTKKEALQRLMKARQDRVSIRKYRGGWHRATIYVLVHGIPIILQIISRIILLPFSPNKNLDRIQKSSYQLAGLVKGLWHFSIRLESSD